MALGTSETGQAWTQSPAGCDWNVRSLQAQLTTAATTGGGGGGNAAALVQKTNDYNIDGATGGTTCQVTFPSPIASGHLLVLSVASDATMAAPPSGWSQATSSTAWPFYYQFYKVAGSSEPQTVTLTQDAAGAWAVTGFEFSGTPSSGVFEREANLNTVIESTTTASTGTTAATSQANELVVAGWNLGGGSVTAAGSYTNSFVGRASQGANGGVWLATASKFTTATGTQESTVTQTSSDTSMYAAAAIAVYKANAAGGGSVTVPSFAVLDTTHANNRVQVAMPTIVNNGGLTFRWLDASNCFRLVADTTNGKWSLRVMLSGTESEIASVAVAPANGDVPSVEYVGDVLTVYVNGTQRAQVTYSAPTLAAQTKAGMTAQATTGVFDDFQVWYRTAAVPAAPSQPSATGGNAQATVNWNAPNTGGAAIDAYEVTCVERATVMTPNPATATSAVYAGLTNGTAYTFRVRAHNSVGWGALSPASAAVTPRAAATAPGAPTIGTPSPGNTQATVNWTAPADNGGAAITSYTVTAYNSSGGAATGVTGSNPRATGSTTTSFAFTGLTNGTGYTFKVAATNSVGTGSQSALSAIATPVGGTTRDARYWPYSSTASPFNRPLGSGATYARDTAAQSFSPGYINSANGYSVPIYVSASNDRTCTINWTGPYSGDSGSVSGVHIPAGATPASGSDSNMIVIEPSGRYFDMYGVSVSGNTYTCASDMNGDRRPPSVLTDTGTGADALDRASNISWLAGCIRVWDVQQGVIRHALAAGILNNKPNASVWPATAGDGQAGGNQSVTHGMWFAIPPGTNLAGLGLQSPYGVMLATAMQQYGIIIGDYAGGDVLYAEPQVETNYGTAYSQMLDCLSKTGGLLQRVTNISGMPSGNNGMGGGAITSGALWPIPDPVVPG